MPSISVHLTISARVAERLGINDLPDYYLGAIAPDAVNIDGFAPQAERYGAHIRSRDVAVWLRNISQFRAEQTRSENPDFVKGFVMHLYTDIAWDLAVQPELFEDLRSRGIAEDQLNTRKWDELRGFDRILSAKPEYINAVAELKKARPLAVTTVTAPQLAEWRDKIAALEYPYPPAEFLGERHLKAAERKALELYFGK